jgi:hypothetical protein
MADQVRTVLDIGMAEADRGRQHYPWHIVVRALHGHKTYCNEKLAVKKRTHAPLKLVGCTACKRKWKAEHGD